MPNKYLKDTKFIYIGVFCENCQYSLKYYFTIETSIKAGDSQLFHLKKGDIKIVKIDSKLDSTTDFIQIETFNLRMSDYNINVEIGTLFSKI